MPELISDEPRTGAWEQHAVPGWRSLRPFATWIALTLLGPLLGLLCYYHRSFSEGLGVHAYHEDISFYIYQLARMPEVGGRWWQLPQESRLGHPYPTVAAHHPGLFEGIDVLLIAAVTGQFLDPRVNMHLIVLLILACNGLVAAYLVRRMSGSYLWAALAVVLITVNFSTGNRVLCHVHLTKYYAVLLSCWAFGRYMDRPTAGRGFWLGLASGLAVIGSYYFGFFLAVALGTWWSWALVSGRLDWDHARPTAVALITAALCVGLATFPVWLGTRSTLFADEYFHHSFSAVWTYSAQFWQFVTPQASGVGRARLEASQMASAGDWHFLGWTNLGTIALYVLLRARGWHFGRHTRCLDRLLMLAGVFLLLSLEGGPGVFLYRFFPAFRCYGRSGLLTLALTCVVVPAVLACVHGRLTTPSAKALFAIVVACALTADVWHTVAFAWARVVVPRGEVWPAWIDWLAGQDSDVRLVAVPDRKHLLREWRWKSLDKVFHHRHQVLNGANFDLLNADLRLLDAELARLNTAGLSFLASLGYTTLAFDHSYLEENPWIATLSWLEEVQKLEGWTIFRTGPEAPLFPQRSYRELFASSRQAPPREVPAGTWITQSLPVREALVTVETQPVEMVWLDEQDRQVGPAALGFFNHLFGPTLPAFVVATPEVPGAYHLVFRNSLTHEELGALAYKVMALPVQAALTATGRGLAAGTCKLNPADGPNGWVATLRNDTAFYLPANAPRSPRGSSLRFHPSIEAGQPGCLTLGVMTRTAKDKSAGNVLFKALLCDLPPHATQQIHIPADALAGCSEPVEVYLHIAGKGLADAHAPQVQMSVEAVNAR